MQIRGWAVRFLPALFGANALSTGMFRPMHKTLEHAGLFALETARSDGLLRDPYAAALAGEELRKLKDTFASRGAEIPGPGMPHIALAAITRALDDDIVSAADGGVEQVVTIGEGMCSRPWRLDGPKLRNVRWFDVEHSEVLRLKSEILKEQNGGEMPPKKVASYAPVAFETGDEAAMAKLTPALQNSGFDPESKTLWLVPGALSWMDVPRAVAFLRAMADAHKSGFGGGSGGSSSAGKATCIATIVNSDIRTVFPGQFSCDFEELEKENAFERGGWKQRGPGVPAEDVITQRYNAELQRMPVPKLRPTQLFVELDLMSA